VEEIVPVGSLDPEAIHLPGVYVHRLIQGSGYEKRIERLRLEEDASERQLEEDRSRERVVKRAALEIKVSTAAFMQLHVHFVALSLA